MSRPDFGPGFSSFSPIFGAASVCHAKPPLDPDRHGIPASRLGVVAHQLDALLSGLVRLELGEPTVANPTDTATATDKGVRLEWSGERKVYSWGEYADYVDVVGVLENTSDATIDSVEVTFNIFDKDVYTLGTASERISDIEPGVLYRFEATDYSLPDGELGKIELKELKVVAK
jgi:hypothetical protein